MESGNTKGNNKHATPRPHTNRTFVLSHTLCFPAAQFTRECQGSARMIEERAKLGLVPSAADDQLRVAFIAVAHVLRLPFARLLIQVVRQRLVVTSVQIYSDRESDGAQDAETEQGKKKKRQSVIPPASLQHQAVTTITLVEHQAACH
jgi:hypothetical protein